MVLLCYNLEHFMSISSRICIFILVSLASISVSYAASSCGWWSWSSSSCGSATSIPYCQGTSCDPDNAKKAVDKATNGIFIQKTAAQYAVDVVRYLLWFVTLVGVIYVIYAGFQLMTGAWDDEKVKKARQTIIYVIVGMVIMWLAYSLVTLILWVLR